MSICHILIPRQILIFLFIIGICACSDQSSQSNTESNQKIVVRMLSEPETISPILAETSLAREAYQYVFLSLADYDYETLELKPVLIKEIPQGVVSSDGTKVSFEMEIRDEAQWSDGKPITGRDVLATIEIALHPMIPASGWKIVLEDIISVETDQENLKKFVVTMHNTNFRNKEGLLSAQIYPAHIYDPESIMERFELSDLSDEQRVKEMSEDPDFQEFVANFSSIKYSKELAEGGGPYELESWNAGQFIVLKRKTDYWGDKFGELDQLEAVPERIVLQFIQDEATALTLLKNDEIDVMDMTRSTYKQFDDLKADDEFADRYDFHTTQLPRYYFLMINNEDTRLADLNVRKALGHLVDVERMMNQIEGGYATRVNSIIHFSKPESRDDLPLVDYNLEAASNMLDEAGWVDSDGDDIRDKMVNGRKEKLSLRLHISGSALSTSVSSIIKEGCKRGGVEIEVIKKPNGATRTENLLTGDFELFISQRTQSTVRYDPYAGFHSSAIGAAGLNFMRYSNEEVDDLIITIRETLDEKERLRAYNEVQKLINDDAPIIFLYSPQLRIISDKDIDPVISSKRPGFFVNASEEM